VGYLTRVDGALHAVLREASRDHLIARDAPHSGIRFRVGKVALGHRQPRLHDGDVDTEGSKLVRRIPGERHDRYVARAANDVGGRARSCHLMLMIRPQPLRSIWG
jgi:hypothetical protein